MQACTLQIILIFSLNLFLTEPGLLLVRGVNQFSLYQAHSLSGYVKMSCLIFRSVKHLHLWLLHTTNPHFKWGRRGIMSHIIFVLKCPHLRGTVNVLVTASVNALLLARLHEKAIHHCNLCINMHSETDRKCSWQICLNSLALKREEFTARTYTGAFWAAEQYKNNEFLIDFF